MTTIDITQALLQETEIDTIIQDNIKPLLLGNEKRAVLESAFVEIVNSIAEVTINVRCRNKQRTCVTIPVVGRECFTAYEDNFTVSFKGVIPNSQECNVSSYSITTANEIYRVLAGVVNILVANPSIKSFITQKICSQIPAVAQAAESLFTFDVSQCVASLGNPVVECNVPVTLTNEGRRTIKDESFGIVLDANCNIAIKFNKQDLLGRVIRDDSIAIPPQEISCTLTTNGGALDIEFLVAPVIRFSAEGRAVSASIGLDDVQGIPAFIGKIIARYVNTSQELSNAIIEPGKLDEGTAPIAKLTDFELISLDDKPNFIDAAIAKLIKNDDVKPSIITIGNVQQPPMMAAISQSVRKYGRTTGQTMGIIMDIAADVRVRFSQKIANFEDQLAIQGVNGLFSQGGDSGSLIVDAMTRRPVGLLFAGGGNQTFACPIDKVLSRFDIDIL